MSIRVAEGSLAVMRGTLLDPTVIVGREHVVYVSFSGDFVSFGGVAHMKARLWKMVLVLVLLIPPSLAPGVQAADPVPVKVTITRVRDIGGNLEGIFESAPDFYAVMTINGVTWQTPQAPGDTADVRPYWEQTVAVPGDQPTVPVSIQIWDNDAPVPDPDIGDASPVPNTNTLNLTVDLSTGHWTGDVPWPGICAIGDDRTNVEVCWTIEVQPRLDLTKTVSATTAPPGTTLTYALTVTALGSTTAATLTDALPEGLTYVPDSVVGGSYDAAQRQIRYDGLISPDGSLRIFYQAVVNTGLSPGTVLTAIASLVGAGRTTQRSVAVTVGEPTFDGTLVLMYGSGDNNLSDALLKLMQRAAIATPNPHIIVLMLIDGPGEDDAYLYQLLPNQPVLQNCPSYQNPTCNGRYVEGQTLWHWSDDVGTAASLSDFLNRTILAYPHASQRVLSLVGHGGGWSPDVLANQPSRHYPQPDGDTLGGMLWDNHPGDSLSTPELGQALQASKIATGRPIDLLYLDACNMAMAEVAYEVRDSVHYLLASEHWKWSAFPYDQHLTDIDDTMDAHQIGATWIGNEAQALGSDYPFTYSLTDLTAMNGVRVASDELANALIAIVTDSPGRALILQAAEATDCFDSNGDGTLTEQDNYCDLASFAREIKSRVSATSIIALAAQHVEDAVAQAVMANQYQNGVAWLYPQQRWEWHDLGGLSIFLPLREDNWRRRYYGLIQYSEDGTWDAFLDAWWQSGPIPDDPACSNEGCKLPPGPVALPHLIYLPLISSS